MHHVRLSTHTPITVPPYPIYPIQERYGGGGGGQQANFTPCSPTVGTPRNKLLPPLAPQAILCGWLFTESSSVGGCPCLLLGLFCDHCSQITWDLPINVLSCLQLMWVRMYCSPQAILSCERWGQIILVQSSFLCPRVLCPSFPLIAVCERHGQHWERLHSNTAVIMAYRAQDVSSVHLCYKM